MKPFLKWVGGKKVILKHLVEEFPNRPITTYYEPFLGGGALFFALRNSAISDSRIILNDTNKDLVNCYQQIRDNLDQVIENLSPLEYDRELFYELRSEYNSTTCPVRKAVLFIYINKCGFNGLYRVNRKGLLNVPFGKYTRVRVCDELALREASEALQGVVLECGSFNTLFGEEIENPEGTFIYFDPPYLQEKKNSFVEYTQYGFSAQDHILLRNTIDFLTCNGCSIMLSNSDTPFIRELYKDYVIKEVYSRRSINSDGQGRKPKMELLIKNYSR